METELNTEIKSFTFSFESSKSPKDIFNLLLMIDKWWSGIHEETISGKSRDLNDEFTFHAGSGAHYSKHRLVELVPNEKIVWQVIDSKLTFVNKTDEWDNTKLRFDITKNGNKTTVTFTHEGLVPLFECYEGCSGAWSQYMKNLEAKLK